MLDGTAVFYSKMAGYWGCGWLLGVLVWFGFLGMYVYMYIKKKKSNFVLYFNQAMD